MSAAPVPLCVPLIMQGNCMVLVVGAPLSQARVPMSLIGGESSVPLAREATVFFILLIVMGVPAM